MFKIPAKDRYLDLSNSPKMYYVLAVASILSILSFVLYNANFFIMIVLLISGIASYIVLSRKPKTVLVVMDEQHIILGETDLTWDKVVGWAMTDLGTTTECIIQTNDFFQPFYYVYFVEGQPGIKEFITYITKYVPYVPSTPSKDIVHRFLRFLTLI
jgi:hypothetical protein